MGRIYVGDIGTILRVTLGVDLTDVVTITLHLYVPTESGYTELIPTIEGSPIDGVITYECLEGDLPYTGVYKLQVKLEYATTTLHSETATFSVYALGT